MRFFNYFLKLDDLIFFETINECFSIEIFTIIWKISIGTTLTTIFFFTKVRWPNFQAHFGKKKPKTILHCTLCYCKERQKKEQVSEKEKQKKGESKKRNAETKLKENGNTKIQKFPRLRNKASRRKKERFIYFLGRGKGRIIFRYFSHSPPSLPFYLETHPLIPETQKHPIRVPEKRCPN